MHVDYLTRDGLEHKVERELVQSCLFPSANSGQPGGSGRFDHHEVPRSSLEVESQPQQGLGLRARTKPALGLVETSTVANV